VRKFPQTYSIFTGVRTDEFRGYGSINEGLLAHYRFTPKVGLETGLMYANTRKNIRANIDYTNEYNELYPDNITRQNTDVSNVIKHNYLRLPLSITYRPRKKIQLAMGLNVGYRFDKIIKNLAEDQVVPMADDADTPTHESAIGINVNDPGSAGFTQIEVSYSFSVPKWDLAAHTGLRYYPIPRLGIDLNYQYGLINMTQGITPNRNSGLQLALVWQLHR